MSNWQKLLARGVAFVAVLGFFIVITSVFSVPKAHAYVSCSLDAVADSSWDNGNFHYISWKISAVANTDFGRNTTNDWLDSNYCNAGNLATNASKSGGRWVVNPSNKLAWVVGANKVDPVAVSFGTPNGHGHPGFPNCASSPIKPVNARPPVFGWSDCREAAEVDDGGGTVINGNTIYCQGLPGVNLGGWSNCGYYPGSKSYPDNAGAGHMFTKYNCNQTDDDHPFGPYLPGDYYVDCNNTDYDNGTFSWYKRPGMALYGNSAGLTSGDGIDAIFPKKTDGSLRNFSLYMAAWNTQVGDFGTRFYLTLKYPRDTSVVLRGKSDPLYPSYQEHTDPNNPMRIFQGDPLLLEWETENATSCRSSANLATSRWAKNPNSRATSGTGFDVTSDTATPNNLIQYTLTCRSTIDGSTLPPANLYVRVIQSERYPWLQTLNGDVLAFGSIAGQLVDQEGGRQSTDPDKEAEYVVIASLNSDWAGNDPKGFRQASNLVAISNFCSSTVNRINSLGVRNSYQFGLRNSSDGKDRNCQSGAYVANIPNEFFNPTDNDDMVISNFLQGKTKSGQAGNGAVCSANRPYKDKGAIDPNASSVPGGVFNSVTDGQCASIYQLSGGNINGFTNRQGMATIYVNGNLTIKGNITNTFAAGGYNSIYDIPNLGIIVKGDVTIEHDVTQIDAAIYAKGVIKTCSSYGNDDCRTKLTVHGALAAKGGFVFGRSFVDSAHSPTELIITNGTYLFSPPPGFEDRYSENIRRIWGDAEGPPKFNSNN